MFRTVATLWRGARGSQLKKEFDDLQRRVLSLSEADARVFFVGLGLAWKEARRGSEAVSALPRDHRRDVVKEAQLIGRQTFERNVGLSFAWAMLSMYIESFDLPGEEAQDVHSFSGLYVAQASREAGVG